MRSEPCVNMESCCFVDHLFTNSLQSSNVGNSTGLMYSLKLAYINRFFWPTMGIIFVFKLGFFYVSFASNSFHSLRHNVE